MRIAGLDELRLELLAHDCLAAASIEVTRRCNQRCIHCLRTPGSDDGLALAEVQDVLDQLAGLGCLQVSLTGGEPFVRADFPEILAYAWRRRFAITVLTNGTLLEPDTITLLKDVHVMEVQISLYGAAPASHDAVTQVPGSYERTLHSIDRLCTAGVSVRVAMPLLVVNAGEAPAVEALCAAMGARYLPGPLIFPRDDGDRGPLAWLPTDEQLRQFIEQRQATTPEVHRDTSCSGTGLCSAGSERLAIGSDGNIYPCDALRVVVGNTRRDRLAGVWHTASFLAELRAIRRRHPADCLGCGARAECLWCPGLSLQLTGDLAMPNAQDCRHTRLAAGGRYPDAPGWSAPRNLANAREDSVI